MRNNTTIGDVLERGYLLTGQRHADRLELQYYKLCKTNKKPLIKANVGLKFATISIDLITAAHDINEEGQERIFRLFRQYTKKPGSIRCSHGFCAVQQVPVDAIATMIEQLRGIYSECIVERT